MNDETFAYNYNISVDAVNTKKHHFRDKEMATFGRTSLRLYSLLSTILPRNLNTKCGIWHGVRGQRTDGSQLVVRLHRH